MTKYLYILTGIMLLLDFVDSENWRIWIAGYIIMMGITILSKQIEDIKNKTK